MFSDTSRLRKSAQTISYNIGDKKATGPGVCGGGGGTSDYIAYAMIQNLYFLYP
jgi:hypothetical protein